MSTQQLQHRGYFGSIEADLDEGFLFGKLLFIRDVVVYQGGSVAELKSAFVEAVEDYLSTCVELGEVPEEPCKGTFNVRIGADLHLKVALAARLEQCSLNEWVKHACADRVERKKGHTVEVEHTRRVVVKQQTSYAIAEGRATWQENPAPLH